MHDEFISILTFTQSSPLHMFSFVSGSS